MSLQLRSLSHRRRILAPSYMDAMLATGPIAYFPLNETTGSVALCLVNPAQNATYSNVTLANDRTGPFNTPAPYFDGSNDHVNIYSAALSTAFNGATGSAMIWARVNAAAVWTDAATRRLFRLYSNGSNYYSAYKPNTNNQLTATLDAGGGLATISHSPYTQTAWFQLLITWSDHSNADEAKLFIEGTQRGATSSALNAWAGAGLDSDRALIGCLDWAGPTQVWHGWLAHFALWDYVLPQATITKLANP